jgi:predicted small lipoprotein YifL
MRRVVGSLAVVAMAWGLAGCGDQAPKSSVGQAAPAPANSPAASGKSTIPADKLAQIVLEVPGMT